MSKQTEPRKPVAAQAEDALGYFKPEAVVARAERSRKASPLDEMYAYFN